MSTLYPTEAFDQAIERLEELAAKKLIYISDGSSGGDKVAELLAFTRGALPALMDLLVEWRSVMEQVGMYPEENRWVIADKMMELATAMLQRPTGCGSSGGAAQFLKALEDLDRD